MNGNIFILDEFISYTFQSFTIIISLIITLFHRYGDGYILIGFEAGYLIAISTHVKEVGQELLQTKNHRDCLSDIALNTTIGKVVSCGDNNLKIHNLRNIEEVEKIITVAGEAAVSKTEWSADGSMIAAVTHSGNVVIYLVEIPRLTSVCGNKIAILSSLSEVFVYSYMTDKVILQSSLLQLLIAIIKRKSDFRANLLRT